MNKLLKFAAAKRFHMEYDKKYVRNLPRCLECGDQIRYGRTDKKFCSDRCKAKHHNDMAKAGKAFRNKIIGLINRNYEILDGLLCAGMDSSDLIDLMSQGFMPEIATSYRRSGKHDLYACYDIKYIMTRTRLYSIMKIKNLSVNLQIGTKIKDL